MVNLNSPMEIAMGDMTRLIDLANSKADTIPDVINANGPMYGAKPGAADNTVALQKAIDAAKAAGRSEVYLSPGHYDYTSLTNTDGIVIVGDGVTLSGSPTLPIVSTAQLADISVNIRSFENYVIDGDWIPAIQQAINYVHDSGGGTVFIPRGVFTIKPGTQHYILLRPKVNFVGAGVESVLKVADETGDYGICIGQADDGTSHERLEGIFIKNFVLDQNRDGNTNCDINHNKGVWHRQHGIEIRNYSRCTYENIHIYGCGYNQMKLVGNVAGSQYGAIRNCYIEFERGSSSINYDNTAIYISGNGYEVTGNVVKTTDATQGFGGIELHGAYAICTNNRVENYDSSIHIVADHPTEHSNAIVIGNQLLGCTRGITLWGGSNQDVWLKGIKINGNRIEPRLYPNKVYVSTSEFAGIKLVSGTILGEYEDITITNNSIIFDPDQDTTTTINTAQSGGIVLVTVTANSNPMSNIDISDNVIMNAPARGIALYHNADASVVIKDSLIARNIIINASTNDNANIPSRSFGIGLRGNIQGTVVVKDNIIRDTFAATKLQAGLYLQVFDPSSKRLYAVNNYAKDVDGNDISNTINQLFVELSQDVILRSPNNTFYKLQVGNDGTLSATSI